MQIAYENTVNDHVFNVKLYEKSVQHDGLWLVCFSSADSSQLSVSS